jgi:hypothetical protein
MAYVNVGDGRKHNLTAVSDSVQFGEWPAGTGIKMTQAGQLWQVTLINKSNAAVTVSIFGVDGDVDLNLDGAGSFTGIVVPVSAYGAYYQVIWYGPAVKVIVTNDGGGNLGAGNPLTVKCRTGLMTNTTSGWENVSA